MPDLKTLKEALGCDLVGVVESSSYDAMAPRGHRVKDVAPRAGSALVAAWRKEGPPRGKGVPPIEVQIERYHAEVARVLTSLNRAAALIRDEGWWAFPVPYRQLPPFFWKKRRSLALRLLLSRLESPFLRKRVSQAMLDMLSYARLAEACGLGVIGRSGLLITPQFGPRVRLAVLLTDAPLRAGEVPDKELCFPDVCGGACARACPVGAIDLRTGKIDAISCFKHILRSLNEGKGLIECGRCVFACPAHKPRFHDRST